VDAVSQRACPIRQLAAVNGVVTNERSGDATPIAIIAGTNIDRFPVISTTSA
jgi:hypothetical protein